MCFIYLYKIHIRTFINTYIFVVWESTKGIYYKYDILLHLKITRMGFLHPGKAENCSQNYVPLLGPSLGKEMLQNYE